MRLSLKSRLGQLFFPLCFLVIYSGCTANKDESPVIPPVTSPLTGNYIGYGVITTSFTHITLDPSESSESLGYLRRGSLVKVVRRLLIRTSDGFISWVLIDGEQNLSGVEVQSGWLKEDVMDIYTYESQARTASESMLK